MREDFLITGRDGAAEPPMLRWAEKVTDDGIRAHLDLLGPTTFPVAHWNRRPERGSEQEALQLAALTGRAATQLRQVMCGVGDRPSRVVVVAPEEIPKLADMNGLDEAQSVAAVLKPLDEPTPTSWTR